MKKETPDKILFIYLFIYGFFNDAVNSSDCVASVDRMINE
jgi:uncharacterized membrane protein